MNEQIINLPITGMTCANCAMNIEKSVSKLAGINETNVNFAAEQAAVSFDPQKLKVSEVVSQIQKSFLELTSSQTWATHKYSLQFFLA